MQFVEGNTLAHRLKQSPLALDAAISIGAQIANALAEAHRQGIVHRDVKPQNVMLSAANHATVLDFGLAKPAALADATSRTATVLTEAGVVSGTPGYMSPEQARGEVVDERSDVFSFGIVLYELVSPIIRSPTTAGRYPGGNLTRDPHVAPIPSGCGALESVSRRIAPLPDDA